jgi:hypothetical protein
LQMKIRAFAVRLGVRLAGELLAIHVGHGSFVVGPQTAPKSRVRSRQATKPWFDQARSGMRYVRQRTDAQRVACGRKYCGACNVAIV